MARKRFFRKSAAVSHPRVLVGLVVVTLVFWWLNWVRAGAAPTEGDDLTQEASDEAPAEPLSQGMETLISLDLRSTEATDALKYLATKGGLNIAISKNVSGRVNLFLTDVPIRDVFDLVLRSNELAFDRQGNVYNIMTEAEYRTLYGKKFADLREVRAFRLQYAIPQQAFNLLDTLKSEIGRLLVDEESGTVMVLDTPKNLRQMEEALRVLEQEGDTRVFDLKYAKAVDVEGNLKDQLEVNKLGYVRADERSNQLIIKTLPDRMREVETLIAALDRKTREVLIDAKIVKITLDDGLDAGVDWNAVFTNLKFHGIDTKGDFRTTTEGTEGEEVPAVTRLRLDGAFSKVTDKAQVSGLGDLLLGTVSTDGYELMRFLRTVGETKVISNPRLLVTENKEAKIHVGTREAYIVTTTTAGQSTSTTAEDVEFIDVGIRLSVTPQINADGFVTMKIAPEVSSVVRTLASGETGNEIPIVDTSTAETTVMVADGQTVILGGLRKNEKSNSTESVPFLSQIPLIGNILFKQVNREDQLTELVVFITPHVVQGDTLVTGDEQQTQVLGFRDYGPVLESRVE